MNYLSSINPEEEVAKIISFLRQTFASQKIDKAVIGISGGIDSAVSLHLLAISLPKENIFPVHLPFFDKSFPQEKLLIESTNISKVNFQTISIKKIVEEEAHVLGINLKSESVDDKTRLGNLMARTRMIVLFDLAKKLNALVSGTENKSEEMLGYFTRFGDQSSDIEPIAHLYKTHVRQIAKHLGVPQEIINQPPSAGLWIGQTDEKQFGFSYEEADQVLHLLFDKKFSLEKIEQLGFSNAKQIFQRVRQNAFKHETPYLLLK